MDLVVNGRVYDAVVWVDGRAVRYELKSWSRWAHWSDGAFGGSRAGAFPVLAQLLFPPLRFSIR